MTSNLYYSRMLFLSFSIIMICICFTHLIDFTAIKLFILALILIVLMIMQLSKRARLVNDNRLSVMYILSTIMFLLIFLRDYFDPLIPIGSFHDFAKADSNVVSGNGLFIDYNLNILIVTYTIIFIYNIINIQKKTH